MVENDTEVVMVGESNSYQWDSEIIMGQYNDAATHYNETQSKT